jgi:hypothetical protein
LTWAALAPERQLPVFCLCFCLRLYPCDSIFLLPAFPIAALQGLLTMRHSKNAVTNDFRLFVVICGSVHCSIHEEILDRRCSRVIAPDYVTPP